MAMAARAGGYAHLHPHAHQRPHRRPCLRPPAAPAARAMSQRRTRTRYRPQGLAFAAFILFAVGGFIFGLVVLNIYIAQSSFRIGELEKDMEQQMAAARELRARIAAAESPARLTHAASELGLVAPGEREHVAVTGPGADAVTEETPGLREFAVSSAVTGRPGRA